MREVFKINGHDYSQYVECKGLSWSRDDVDGPNAGRSMDTVMHRDKRGTKRNLSLKLVSVSEPVLAQLDDDLSSETFSASYRDLHGVQTRQFYCSSFKAVLDTIDDEDEASWGDASFSIHEV